MIYCRSFFSALYTLLNIVEYLILKNCSLKYYCYINPEMSDLIYIYIYIHTIPQSMCM